MQQQKINDTGEWHTSPLKLLAGCATFPFSLVYHKWKRNDENPGSGVESRKKKNLHHAPSSSRDSLQIRKRYIGRRKIASEPADSSLKKKKVQKERGGKEDADTAVSVEKASRLKGNLKYDKVSKNGRNKSYSMTGHDQLKQEILETSHKPQSTKDSTAPKCCISEDAVKKYISGASKGADGLNQECPNLNRNSMCKDCIEKYEKGIQMNYIRNLTILWFPPNFSQSKFGDRSAGSNACTLITILVSYKCHKTGLKLPNIRLQEAWEPLMNILAESIVEGNTIHERLRRDGKLIDENLTVPEAIDATKDHVKTVNEWESNVVSMRMKTSLFDFLSNKVIEWYTTPLSQMGSDLYVIVICHNRSVVMIFQREAETVTLVDSHSHYPHGAAIAQVPFKKLRELCNWYSCILKDSSERPIRQYELSYIYFGKTNGY